MGHKGTRTVLLKCKYQVCGENSIRFSCNKPAVATWDWGNGLLYVCEKHDERIEEEEMEEDDPAMTSSPADDEDEPAEFSEEAGKGIIKNTAPRQSMAETFAALCKLIGHCYDYCPRCGGKWEECLCLAEWKAQQGEQNPNAVH